MTGLRRILQLEARDALVFTGSNLLNRLGALLVVPLYWSQLSPADYGAIAVIGVVGAFQGVFSSLSLDLAITRFFYEWPEEDRPANLGAIWTTSWAATTATLLVALIVVPFMAPLVFPEISAWTFGLGVVGNALANLFIIPASTIRIQRLPRTYAALNLLGFGLAVGLGLTLVLTLKLGLNGFLWSVIFANLVMAVVGATAMRRVAHLTLRSPGIGEAIDFSLRAMPAQIVSAIGSVIDRVLLGILGDLRTLGIYAVAQRFADVIGALHSALKMTFGPFMMRSIASRADGRDLVARVTPFYLLPYFVVGVAISLYIDPFVRFVRQPEFDGVAVVVPWLVGIGILGSLYFYYCNGLFLGRRTDLLLRPAILQVGVLAAASLVLIGPLQIAGVIASRYLAAVAFLGASLYLSQRIFRFEHQWAPLIGLSLAAVAAVLVGRLLPVQPVLNEVATQTIVLGGFVALGAWTVGGRRLVAFLRSRATAGNDEPVEIVEDVDLPSDRGWSG